jgi:hypothetical protein
MTLTDRIEALSEGPNHLALPMHGDSPFELHWVEPESFDDYPELEDVADALDGYLMLAAAQRSDTLLPILVAKQAPHAVSMFFDGFHVIAPSLEALAKQLENE